MSKKISESGLLNEGPTAIEGTDLRRVFQANQSVGAKTLKWEHAGLSDSEGEYGLSTEKNKE